MLDATLATRFEPGTNVRGEATGASWSFLLPSLELGRVLCVGVPSLATLRTLARLAREVWVLVARRAEGEPIRKSAARAGLDRVKVVVALAEAGLGRGSLDLVVACGPRGARRLRREPELREPLERCLAPAGQLWFESRGPGGRGLERSFAGGGTGSARAFRLAPRRGEAEVVAPARDAGAVGFLARRGLLDSPLRFVPRGLARQLEGSALTGPVVRRLARTGWLTGGPGTEGPPEYLRAIAAGAGIDVAGLRFALSAQGRYASRKVVFFLFERDAERPRLVVKLTRDPAWNARLENEYRALLRLAELGRVFENRAPRALFLGHHGGLALVGESALDGVPLRERTRGTVDCPVGRAAIDWLLDLGAASADRASAEPGVLANALGELLTRFAEIYPLGESERSFLADQIRLVGKETEPVPLVFQHGDPGVWNAVFTRAGRVAFLDWEAGEPEGLPLWDLLYFLRSYAMQAGPSHGRRDWLEKSARHFRADTPLHALFASAVRRGADRAKLPGRLVGPLFFTCWMHRALKEATRLRGRALAQGRYFGLLRLFVARRQERGLRRLLEV